MKQPPIYPKVAKLNPKSKKKNCNLPKALKVMASCPLHTVIWHFHSLPKDQKLSFLSKLYTTFSLFFFLVLLQPTSSPTTILTSPSRTTLFGLLRLHSNTLSLHQAQGPSLPLGATRPPQQRISPFSLPFNLPQHSLSGSDSNSFLYVSRTRTPKLLYS